MTYPSTSTFPGATVFPTPAQLAPTPLGSDGRSTVYRIGSLFTAVNNGQPYVDDQGCWWSVTAEQGWSGRSALRADVTKWPQRDSQLSQNLFFDGRDITIGGTIRAPDQQRLQQAMDLVDGLLTSPRVDLLTVDEPHLTRYAWVRRGAAAQVAKWSPYTATFVLQLVADDWRRLGAPQSASTFLPSSSGGLVVPVALPFSIASTTTNGVCRLTNPGTVTGPVTLRLDGPVNGPVVTHSGTGARLVFKSSVSLVAGEWIDVDMENQTVLANGQASRDGWVVETAPDFGWFGFEPGVNEFALAAAAYDAASKLTVTAAAAW